MAVKQINKLTDTNTDTNTENHLTYNYQFFKHFPPILDDLHSKCSGEGMPPDGPHWVAHA